MVGLGSRRLQPARACVNKRNLKVAATLPHFLELMKNKTSGFTLIELMIAVVITGIGILAVGWILLLNQRSWKEGNAKLQLQRDTYYAILRMEHELKPASLSDVVCNSSELVIDNNGKKFFLDSHDLWFQESSTDPQELVVEGDPGTEFDVTTSNDIVNINFTLVRGNLESVIATSVMPRN